MEIKTRRWRAGVIQVLWPEFWGLLWTPEVLFGTIYFRDVPVERSGKGKMRERRVGPTIYLRVAFVNGMRDGLHKVVPHAAIWVGVDQLLVSLIASLVAAAAGGLDKAQQRTTHQDQQESRRRACGDGRFHDWDTRRLLALQAVANVSRFLTTALLTLCDGIQRSLTQDRLCLCSCWRNED